MEFLKWFNCGSLGQIKVSENCFEQGVYLFVHNGSEKRIIYVGTVEKKSTFLNRWAAHLGLFFLGGRTMWRASNSDDIYKIMAYEGDMIAYYKKKAEKNQLWAPGDFNNEKQCYNDYYKKKPFSDGEWRDYLLKNYLQNINLWVCPLKNGARILESQIQLFLTIKHNIGYYINYSRGSWLGRIESSSTVLLSKKFIFHENYFPEVDENTLGDLKNLEQALRTLLPEHN